jgi:hypothetical protein
LVVVFDKSLASKIDENCMAIPHCYELPCPTMEVNELETWFFDNFIFLRVFLFDFDFFQGWNQTHEISIR